MKELWGWILCAVGLHKDSGEPSRGVYDMAFSCLTCSRCGKLYEE